MFHKNDATRRAQPAIATPLPLSDRSPGPLILGIGGTTRQKSSSEQALRRVLAAAASKGARTELIGGQELLLPIYAPETEARSELARKFVDAVRNCDGLVIASPAYHGSISGLVKNALDYLEDTRGDQRPYLQDRVVGCIVCAYGDQAIGTTLVTMRSVAHALRGWSTPFNVGLNALKCTFDDQGFPTDLAFERQFQMLAAQMVEFAHMAGKMKLAMSAA